MNPFFDIRREKLITESGIELDNRVALINDETNKPVGFVSKGYKVTTNKEIKDIFDSALDIAFKDNDKNRVIDHMDATGRRWKRQIILGQDEFQFNIKDNDMVGIMLTVSNGYDGKTAVSYDISGFRYMCTNGLVTGIKKMFSDSFAHVTDNIEQLVQSFNAKFSMFNNTIGMWEEWARLPYSKTNFEKFLEKRDYLSNKTREVIMSRYEPIMNKYPLDESKWSAFNVLTELTTHETKARKGSNVFSNGFKTLEKVTMDFYKENQLAIQ